MAKKVEEVRDGYLGDLPEELRTKVMNIHKVIVDSARAEFKNKKYDTINKTTWAKQWLDQFLAEPSDKNHIGSVRVYKKGKRYRCMIQATGHVDNHRNSEEEELFHGLIRNVFVSIRAKVRKLYDCTITCESEHGEPFEGYDIWPKQKAAQQVWDYFESKKVKKIKEYEESYKLSHDVIYAEYAELPYGLAVLVESTINDLMETTGIQYTKEMGDLEIYTNGADYIGGIDLLSEDVDISKISDICEKFNAANPGKMLVCEDGNLGIIFIDNDYSRMLYEYMEDHIDNHNVFIEEKEFDIIANGVSFHCKPGTKGSTDVYYNDEYIDTVDAGSERQEMEIYVKDHQEQFKESFIMEAANNDILHSLSKQINDERKKGNVKIDQNLLNVIASEINKSYIKEWAPGFKSVKINLSKKGEFGFVLPKMDETFVLKYVNGRTSLKDFLLTNKEITMAISNDTFNTVVNNTDVVNFFKAALKFYSVTAEQYSEKIMGAINGLPKETKQLFVTTSMRSIVKAPIQMIFKFDKVNMNKPIEAFNISKTNISALERFIKGIDLKSNSSAKEKKEVVDNVDKLVKAFRESCGDIQFGELSESVSKWYDGKYDVSMEMNKFYNEQVDLKWLQESTDPQIKYFQEKLGVKKLKKIPRDVVAYISIEAEAIKDANDKMMIASYCLSKLEIVEWYIELLETGSKKYIVPHNKPYLDNIRTQLLACYKKIMDTPINKKSSAPIYPAGYEG